MRKELGDFTTADWIDAKTSMNANSFKQLVKVGRAGGIAIPSTVVPNFSPRITFQSLSGDQTSMYLRVKDTEALNKFNKGVKDWAANVEVLLKDSAEARFSHRLSDQISAEFPRLSESISTKIRFDKQFKLETKSVGFTLARHGVYLHQGAGRGYGGLTGSKWTDKYGHKKTVSDLSRGRMGTGNRTAEHWFNDIIKNNMDELADITAEYSLDLVINVDSIFLPE